MALISATGSSQRKGPPHHQIFSLLCSVAFFCNTDTPDYQSLFHELVGVFLSSALAIILCVPRGAFKGNVLLLLHYTPPGECSLVKSEGFLRYFLPIAPILVRCGD